MKEALGHEVLDLGISAGARRHTEGCAFSLCVEKHSELPPDERKYKCRVVCEGSFVSDLNSNVAVFGG